MCVTYKNHTFIFKKAGLYFCCGASTQSSSTCCFCTDGQQLSILSSMAA